MPTGPAAGQLARSAPRTNATAGDVTGSDAVAESHGLQEAAYAAWNGVVWRLGGLLPRGPPPAPALPAGLFARGPRICSPSAPRAAAARQPARALHPAARAGWAGLSRDSVALPAASGRPAQRCSGGLAVGWRPGSLAAPAWRGLAGREAGAGGQGGGGWRAGRRGLAGREAGARTRGLLQPLEFPVSRTRMAASRVAARRVAA